MSLQSMTLLRALVGLIILITPAPRGEYFEINSANKTTASVIKKIWMAIKRTAVDIWAFPSCPYCGGISRDPNVEPTPYNLGQAWNYAGEQSSQVE